MMNTQMTITTATMDLSDLADEAIEAFFLSNGLGVEVVDHCDRADCPSCFAPLPQAA